MAGPRISKGKKDFDEMRTEAGPGLLGLFCNGKRISNPSTALRTGIEQGKKHIGLSGGRKSEYQDVREMNIRR